MEKWQIIAATIGGLLTLLGGGIRWLLMFVFRELEKRDTINSANQTAFLEELRRKDAETDAQRELRLQDREQHTKTLLELIEKFRSSLDRRGTSIKPDSR